jgi:hypothetical protein
MIDRNLAKKLIEQLGGQHFCPQSPEAEGLLVKALKGCAENQEHGQEIINEALRLVDHDN